MLYILFGADDYSLNKSLEALKKETGDTALLSTNTSRLDGRQVTLDQLRAVCETLPFLSPKRLVIVTGLLERFDAASKTRSDDWKPLAACIHRVPGSTVLVLVDSKVSRQNPLLKELSTQAVVKSFPALRYSELRQWVGKYTREQGSTMSPQAVDLLSHLVGGNLWVMASEIDKLVLFAPGRRIEEKDVKAVVSDSQQTSVFAMIDALLEFKAGLAGELMHQLLRDGASPAYLLVMLARQARMIVRVRELRNQGRPEAEIRSKFGLASDFVWQKTVEQVGRYPLERIKEFYRRLLATDLAIKTGKYKDDLALDILVAELYRRPDVSISK
ncbi:MAG: DNA polymerase III subunit delta [Dehalococcoidales bacterium]|nr:DNA polymerase III subunit delta [Dehalococcoidales bacterium]